MRGNLGGNKYIQRLAIDLKDYGKEYSYRQLNNMLQFANTFASDEIGPQAVVQIAWGTIIKCFRMMKLYSFLFCKSFNKNFFKS